MSDYVLADRHLGLSDDGVHLLRNGFNHTTIPWSDISSAKIKRGNALKNKAVLLIIGIGLIALTVYLTVGLIDTYLNTYSTIYIEGILIIVFSLLLGCYCIFAVLKKEQVLIFEGSKTHTFSLKAIHKEGKADLLSSFLKAKALL